MEEKKDLRKRFEQIISDNLEQLETDIKELEPKDRIKVLIDISKFVLPTLKSVQETKPIRDNKIEICFVESKKYDD